MALTEKRYKVWLHRFRIFRLTAKRDIKRTSRNGMKKAIHVVNALVGLPHRGGWGDCFFLFGDFHGGVMLGRSGVYKQVMIFRKKA